MTEPKAPVLIARWPDAWMVQAAQHRLTLRIEVKNGVGIVTCDGLPAHYEVMIIEGHPVVLEGYFTEMRRESKS